MRPAHPVADLAAFLIGDWCIHRVGWQGAPDRTMRLLGTARFEPCSDGLILREQGIMALGAYRGHSARGYLFREPRGPRASVCFDSGAPFHDLDLSSGFARVRHDCAPDCYEGRYRVIDSNKWILTWRVVGPRKRYLIASRFARLRG